MEYIETGQGAGENSPCQINSNVEKSSVDLVNTDQSKNNTSTSSMGSSNTDDQSSSTNTNTSSTDSDQQSSNTAIDTAVENTNNDTENANSIELQSNKDSNVNENEVKCEEITFKVIYNKVKHDVTSLLDNTIDQLKTQLESIIGIPKELQKVMYKGLARNEQTLRSLGVTQGAKVMIVGSKLDDVLAVSGISKESAAQEERVSAAAKEPLCKQKIHRKVLDKGIPDDVMPGLLNSKEPLPTRPLSGMLNKHGGKVRLTFKLEQDQVWLGTRERTEKLPMSSIKSVISEPIEGFEHYHLMGLQLGPTEASRYWIYWVPAQYIDAIKDAILGKWQYF